MQHLQQVFSLEMEAGDLCFTDGAKYQCLLFDMDDTLYPLNTGLNFACRKNIEDYMLHQLGIEEKEVPRMCLELYREYGTTMAGLKDLGYEFDDDEFHAYVHGRLPYETLKPDPILRNILLSLPQRKIIFTNADKNHVVRVLSRLGLEDCFEGVICYETLNPPTPVQGSSRFDPTNEVAYDSVDVAEESDDGLSDGECDALELMKTSTEKMVQKIICKPSLTAMQAAIRIANLDPAKTLFFDDSARNIASAKIAGLQTVIVGSSSLVPGADYALSNIHNIKEALPQIWENEEEQYLEQFIRSTVETVVLA